VFFLQATVRFFFCIREPPVLSFSSGPASPKNPGDRLPHDAGIEVPIAFPLLLRLVPYDLIDYPLVNSLTC